MPSEEAKALFIFEKFTVKGICRKELYSDRKNERSNPCDRPFWRGFVIILSKIYKRNGITHIDSFTHLHTHFYTHSFFYQTGNN